MIVLAAPREGRVDFSFTVHRDDYARALELTRKAADDYTSATVAGDDRVAKLAVVGSGMRSHAGVAAKLFATLGGGGHQRAPRLHVGDQDQRSGRGIRPRARGARTS